MCEGESQPAGGDGKHCSQLCEDPAPASHQSRLDQLGKQWFGFRRALLLLVQLKWTVLGLYLPVVSPACYHCVAFPLLFTHELLLSVCLTRFLPPLHVGRDSSAFVCGHPVWAKRLDSLHGGKEAGLSGEWFIPSCSRCFRWVKFNYFLGCWLFSTECKESWDWLRCRPWFSQLGNMGSTWNDVWHVLWETWCEIHLILNIGNPVCTYFGFQYSSVSILQVTAGMLRCSCPLRGAQWEQQPSCMGLCTSWALLADTDQNNPE